MPCKIIQKDITTVEEPFIIMHGVNCQDKMGSGVAKALYTKWPLVKEAYHLVKNKELGWIDIVRVADKGYVVNCFTQEFYGYDGKRYADLKAIETCIRKVLINAEGYDISNIYSPKIGCGLGGLDWETEVKPLFENTNITICELNNES